MVVCLLFVLACGSVCLFGRLCLRACLGVWFTLLVVWLYSGRWFVVRVKRCVNFELRFRGS